LSRGALDDSAPFAFWGDLLLRSRDARGAKKSKKKAASRELKPIAPEPVAQAPIERNALRDDIKTLVCANAVKMVRKTIAQVGNGHYQGMKYLFEMIGLFPAIAQPETHEEDSLAGMLLSRLGIPEEACRGTAVTKNQSLTACAQGNTVK
jgi:hypothetical protein